MKTQQPRPARAHGQQRLTREEIIRVALRLLDQHGLEKLSLRELASELGVTPAAVSWHVRSKEELLEEIVSALVRELKLSPSAGGSWTDRLRELHYWFRSRLLEQKKLVFTPAFRKVLPYAFMQVGVAGRNALRDAGFQGADLELASRALYWHTASFVLNEVGMSQSPPPMKTPKLVLDGVIDALDPGDFASFVESLPQLLNVDTDSVFKYSLDRLLRGLEKELERLGGTKETPRRNGDDRPGPPPR